MPKITIVEGNKGTGMALSSTMLAYKIRKKFGKKVISSFSVKTCQKQQPK